MEWTVSSSARLDAFLAEFIKARLEWQTHPQLNCLVIKSLFAKHSIIKAISFMSTYSIFTSESVSEGHPDKMADQISDAVLDAILKDDPHSRVAVETMVKTGMAIIADNDGEQQIYRIGEEVSPGVTPSALEFDHVVLSRGGSRELLYLDQSQPAPSIQPAVRPEQAAPPTPSGRSTSRAASAAAP